MPELSFIEAIGAAMREEMQSDPRVMLIGEDVGTYGGAFKTTLGLLGEFGPERVIDTPISEAAVVGAAAGAAMCGMRPIAELQFIDFISCAGFDQLVTVAAKSRYRNGVGCPMVLRGPSGGGTHGGPFHSACPEMWAVTTPGLKVVFPSTPADAKGLLKAAIRDPDPVLFLEHKFLYRRIKGEVPAGDYITPIGKAALRREGDDAVVITFGALAHSALDAATQLEAAGHSVAVLDLRTLSPLDEDAIADIVAHTSRALIVHEHPRRGGIAGEVAAIINERVFDQLDAPIARLTAPDTPVPYSPPLESAYIPQASEIAAALGELLAY